MNEISKKLHKPWLVAVWPGMGHVAISAGYYLISKLGMHVLAEFSPRGLFEVDHVEVKEGIIRPAGLPRSRFFVWNDPHERHDLVVFIGEAQPPVGKYNFCQTLIEFAKQLGVERVFTFAAMATDMHPEQPSRVFGAATGEEGLAELKRLDLESLQDGNIGGLNGILLAAAYEAGLPGSSLLGEMPQIFAQLPFPKASLAVLEVFTRMAEIELDFTELAGEASSVEEKLSELLERVKEQIGETEEDDEDESEFGSSLAEEPRLTHDDEERVEGLFELARKDRAKAYVLKGELDRLGVFKDYEDRFLDLFKKQGQA